jgi:3-oxoacyl-[acyl-carrier protein] reductase
VTDLSAAAAAGRFALQRCLDCDAKHYPPREVCASCLSPRLIWEEADGAGSLVAETVLHHSFEPFFRERLPWRIGVVRLDAGPNVIAHLHSRVPPAPTRLRITARLDESGNAVLFGIPESGAGISDGDRQLNAITGFGSTADTSVKTPRVALVTGGSSGIGAAIVRTFLQMDYEVISLDQRPSASQHARLHAFEVDLSDPQATRAAAREVARRFAVTTVVHNAGAVLEKPLPEVAIDDFTVLSQLHLAAPIILVQETLPAMKAARYGRIVLISTRAIVGLANRTVYAATKAGMVALARTWTLELAQHGITTNVVAPGPIAGTEMFESHVPRDSDKRPKIIESIPVKRLGCADDVVRAVQFFISPEAGFVTGQTLFVCGGTSVGGLLI